MAKPLSADEIAILKQAFDEYDSDKGGNITIEEFGRVMKQSGQNPTEAELAQIIKEVDLDGDGTINFDEFIAMMTGRTREVKEAQTEKAPEAAPLPVGSEVSVDSETEWKSAWKTFEPSLQGSITAAQLRQLCAGLGETISDVEVDGMMKDVDAEEKISYREFAEFMKGKNDEGSIIDSY